MADLVFANSAAILRYPETHGDWVRPGIMLYGCSPFPEGSGLDLGLKPAMTLESRIIAVQHMKRGDTVGYGGWFKADRDTRVGVVACGYADGYPRHAPTGTPVMVEGRMTITLGRVSMDMLCADLTGIPEAGLGSRVVLWGAEVPVERVAAASATVGYQLLCALAPRVRVVAAEYPTGEYPPSFAPFSLWGDTLTLERYALEQPSFPIAPDAAQYPFMHSPNDRTDLGRLRESHYPDPKGELAAWAQYMGNCIAGPYYVGAALKGRCVLVALRNPSGRLLANVELRPEPAAWRLGEFRARFNATLPSTIAS